MPGNSKERNVVLNFKMDGQVQVCKYIETNQYGYE